MSSLLTRATKPLLLLGSGSFTRKQILSQAGYSFEVVKADIDEYALGDRSDASRAADLVSLLGNAKADAIISQLRASGRLPLAYTSTSSSTPCTPPSAYAATEARLLLTADQVVVCNGEILEKPQSEAQARRCIAMYALHPCRTVGSIVLTSLATGRRVSGVDTCTIRLAPIPETTIQTLLGEGMVFNCAGGLMIEHPLIQECIQSIEGSVDSVMGLSAAMLERLVGELGSGLGEGPYGP